MISQAPGFYNTVHLEWPLNIDALLTWDAVLH